MFFNTLRSEWTKLTSTASFYWTTALSILLTVSLGMLMALLTRSDPTLGTFFSTEVAVSGFYGLGLPVLMIQAIMVVTTERRYGLTPTSFLATPVRWQVALAKALLYAFVAAVITVVALLAAILVSKLLLVDTIREHFHPFDSAATARIFWAYPLIAALVVVFGQALGWLLRHTAGAIALGLLWFLALELTISMLPKVGAKVAKFLPFENLNNFLTNNSELSSLPWSPTVSLGVFCAWAFGLWILGVLYTEKRDA